MGGLWVDYGLMSNIGGLFVLGEANYSVQVNRLEMLYCNAYVMAILYPQKPLPLG